MPQRSVYKLIPVLIASSALLLAGCGDQRTAASSTSQAEKPSLQKPARADTIARVGDEVITYDQLDTMLNSSVMVGASIPQPGTVERSTLMRGLLDKVIDAHLLYLDARRKGTDRLTSYTEDVYRFEDAIIATLYKSEVLIGEPHISEGEVLDYYNNRGSKEAGLTDDIKLTIESMLRRQKLDALTASMRERLRRDVDVVIDDRILSPSYDELRSDADVVARYDSHRVIWSQVKELMQDDSPRADRSAFYLPSHEERRRRLNGMFPTFWRK